MTFEMGLWRVDGGQPRKLSASGVPREQQLEDMLLNDPSTLGERLLILGRQVATSFGTIVDILAIDVDGDLHVLELKRNRTPRDVVAQALDYGSWVSGLGHQQVQEIFAIHHPGVEFEEAFTDVFGGSPPDALNTAHQLTIIAAEIDAATERIVGYLNTGFGVPINVVFFRYYQDGDRAYLARTWLLDAALDAGATTAGRRGAGSKEQWNGTDWYVSFGEFPDGRNWDDARRYGFVSAGGGEWFTNTLRKLPLDARVFAYIPKQGYVGVGHVTGEARPFDDAAVEVEGQERKLADLPLEGSYTFDPKPGEDMAEYVVPVRWEKTRPRTEAVREKGLFANQNSACPLRNRFTLTKLAEAFGLDEAE